MCCSESGLEDNQSKAKAKSVRFKFNYDDVDTSEKAIDIRGKQILKDNNWKFSYTQVGVYVELEYDGNDTKYKSNGGVLKIISAGIEMIFPLYKSTNLITH